MPGIFLEHQDDAVIYVTEACNSNCVMCPMSLASRKRGSKLSISDWNSIPGIIPKDVAHITITGGEPFLEHQQLAQFLQLATLQYSRSEILILTNGRALSIDSIFDEIAPYISNNICFAVPIHSSDSILHDTISQTDGSFLQTIRGLEKLKATNAKVEIRIVGHQYNISHISDTIKYLSNSGLRIDIINIIAMEMTGCAAANRDKLWVDYDRLCESALPGIRYAILHGINIGLYNFPFCMVPKELWPVVKDSITSYKIRFDNQCTNCRMRNICGGLFYSTYELGLCHVKPIEVLK